MPRGKSPGPSILRPKVYERLRQKGMSKSMAAKISNAGTTHKKRSQMARKAAKTRKKRGR